eukprot:gnl/TRDRNA2_/TRDRNA2_197229_c0_seq1.p1 gnl/TRDRNA2_/TRDRNA2_197229_c0~~gnl/TRDRNA2_/TRDRNA2_197229_c0_seq1.p1  ORF type:complete len:240 (-),score=46.13 gnl/TRDRNA2_/TRDRNA2_197229_c0_seq1:31-720(-)
MPPHFQVKLDSGWKGYAPEDDDVLHRASLAGKPFVVLKSRGWTYRCDLRSWEQVNLTTGKVREIRPLRFQVKLENGWQDYMPDADQLLKSAYLASSPGVKIKRCGITYECDLLRMVQMNLTTRGKRKIRLPAGWKAAPQPLSDRSSSPLAVAKQKLKVVEKQNSQCKVTKAANGSATLMNTRKKEKKLSDARTGQHLETRKVTKQTKLERKKGKMVKTETIVIKRIKTK